MLVDDARPWLYTLCDVYVPAQSQLIVKTIQTFKVPWAVAEANELDPNLVRVATQVLEQVYEVFYRRSRIISRAPSRIGENIKGSWPYGHLGLKCPSQAPPPTFKLRS